MLRKWYIHIGRSLWQAGKKGTLTTLVNFDLFITLLLSNNDQST